MRGFPKFFNTKQDVLNVIDEFPDQTKTFLQQCVNEPTPDVEVALVKGEGGKVVEAGELQEGEEKVEGSKTVVAGPKLSRLGFTLEEAQELAQ